MSYGDVLMTVKDVSLKLGENQILEKVNLEIRDRLRPGQTTGQVVGLLGPSGVGKTRLLRILAGLDTPDEGVVLGADQKPVQAGTVGALFQNYPLLRHRTVLGNLLVAAKINGLTGDAALTRSRELLTRFGIAERADFYSSQISGGQRQRAALAQQLVVQKSVLILDEPFSGLDPAALEEVIRLLVEVAHMHELNTMVIITHDIRAAMIVCDTVYLLGRDRDAGGKVVSGARIQKTYDLVERGLAWRKDVEDDPKFAPLERELRGHFRAL